jgi:hypothetical protein
MVWFAETGIRKEIVVEKVERVQGKERGQLSTRGHTATA